MVEMIETHGRCAYMDVHAICCAFNVPTLHLVSLIPKYAVRYLTCIATRTIVTSPPPLTQMHIMRGFELMQNSLERHNSFRYHFEVYCLTRKVTNDFKVKIQTDHLFGSPDWYENNLTVITRPLYARLSRLLSEVFGVDYETLLGSKITMTILNTYLILNGYEHWCVPFKYNIQRASASDKPEQQVKLMQSYPNKLIDKIDWFLTGRHRPLDSRMDNPYVVTVHKRAKPNLDHKCVMLNFPESEAIMHVNIQVAHLRVFSKTRMRYSICGKSLVFTVAKKKTIACSSYKTVPPDNVLRTHITLNFNIHGHDTTMMIALLILDKTTSICGFDDTDPFTTSHNRTSSHSFQNGVMDINHYRHKVMELYPKTCSKVPYFPAVKMTNLGLLHRESVLFNTKGDVRRAVNQICHIVRTSSEMDLEMATNIYKLESDVREMVDNHILGMVKIAWLLGLTCVSNHITEHLKFDRLLIGLNPKTTKSEFADKSKFDSESKGKASKKIKTPDDTKNRKDFLAEVNSMFPDVSIDHANANSRGKWSFLDRINHCPDWTFYSPMMRWIIKTLRRTYTTDSGYHMFNKMLKSMRKHLRHQRQSSSKQSCDYIALTFLCMCVCPCT